MKKSNLISSFLIQLSIGGYFFISGLLGIIGHNSGGNQLMMDIGKVFGKSNYLPLIIAICFLVSGMYLVLGLFLPIKQTFITLIVLAIWVIYIFINYFTDNFLKPDLLPWLRDVFKQLIILAGLWSVSNK